MSGNNFKVFGNIPNTSLLSIFKSYNYLVFNTINSPTLQTCIKCDHKTYCIGCIIRGMEKARKIGFENCNWLNTESIDKNKNKLLRRINNRK